MVGEMLGFCISENVCMWLSHSMNIMAGLKNSRSEIIFLHNFQTIVPLSSNFKVTNEKPMKSRFRTLWVCSAQKAFRIHFLARVLIFHKGTLWCFLLGPCGVWGASFTVATPVLQFWSTRIWYFFDKMLPSVSLDSFWGTYVGWIFDLLELCSKFPTFLFLFFISVFFFYFWWDLQFYLLFCFLLFLKSCFPYLGWFSFQHLSLLMTKALPKMYKLCVSGLGLKGPHFRVMG